MNKIFVAILTIFVVPAAVAVAALSIILSQPNERHGSVIVIRHSIDTPGFGDRTEQCDDALTPAGKSMAEDLGRAWQGRKIAKVVTSPICRAMETAWRLGGTNVEVMPELDNRLTGVAATQANKRLREAIDNWAGPGALVMVTHGGVISELSGRRVGKLESVTLAPSR